MSIRTMASLLSNKKLANALHNSVLPTPVGPRNRNEPLGRLGSEKADRIRFTALDTAVIAGSCPTTWLCTIGSMLHIFSRSSECMYVAGRLVHLRTLS